MGYIENDEIKEIILDIDIKRLLPNADFCKYNEKEVIASIWFTSAFCDIKPFVGDIYFSEWILSYNYKSYLNCVTAADDAFVTYWPKNVFT